MAGLVKSLKANSNVGCKSELNSLHRDEGFVGEI